MGHLVALMSKKPVVFASFNGPDSSTALPNADTGQAWVPTGTVTWGTVGGKAKVISGAGRANIDSKYANAIVKCKFDTVFAASAQRVLLRYKDDSNELYFGTTAAGQQYVLSKRVAGAVTTIGTATQVSANGDNLVAVLLGSLIVCYVNGVKAVEVSETFNQTETRHGMFASTTSVSFDNFSVEV